MTTVWETDEAHYMALAKRLTPAYLTAAPFPHAVIDDFLPLPVLQAVQEDFPKADSSVWHEFANERERKFALSEERHVPPAIVAVLRTFNAQAMVRFMRTLTGIADLVPDPDLIGGGLHQILPGGMLKVHADFNLHPIMGLQRRANALLFLNDDWDESYGGFLELWDQAMTAPVVKLAPTANRLVVFNTTSDSYHGHPDPLTCPEGRSRRSLALYYYSRPASDAKAHNTLFQARPGETVDLPFAERARIAGGAVKRLVWPHRGRGE